MSGYKLTIINDDCASFHTFDGDSVSLPSYTLDAIPLEIMDEIGLQNNAILHVQTEPPYGYRLGTPSLVDLEPNLQSSICFGYYGHQPSHPDSGWAKAFLEIPHSATYIFPNHGAFTLEFLMKKQNETEFRTIHSAINIVRPIIKKEDVLNITYSGNLLGDNFYVTFPSGNNATIPASTIIDRIVHFCMIWDIKEITTGNFQSTEMVMIDGRIVYENHVNYTTTFPTTNFNTPWEIGGVFDSPNSTYDDRNTSPLYLDQIAIYDKALTVAQVENHYKKIYSYNNMIANDKAIDYFPMNEADSLIDWSVYNALNSNHGIYYGELSTLHRGQLGPDLFPGEDIAPIFSQDSMAYFYKSVLGNTIPWFNINSDYAIEFWFKTTNTTKGILFSIQDEKPPFHGITVSINEKDNNPALGVLEFNESGNKIHSIETIGTTVIRYNDDVWHHVVVQRKSNTLEFWVDANLQGTLSSIATTNIDFSGVMYLMGCKPNNLNVTGQVCKFARYTTYLQPQQIHARYSYSKIYRIRGTVTLSGIPTRANVRIMDNYTGKLITEIESNVLDGTFEYYLPNNNTIDLMIYSRTNLNIRPRAYSPIVPTGNIDLPIII